MIGVAAGFPTTVNPILQFGAVPVFVDVDRLTHNIDASKITHETLVYELAQEVAPYDEELLSEEDIWGNKDFTELLMTELNLLSVTFWR